MATVGLIYTYVMRLRRFRWKLPSHTLLLGERTLLMGVLNVTPDSFSDAGQFLDPKAALARALQIEAAGADILDLGGESTRPGAKEISPQQELERVLPVLRALRGRLRIPISIDTRKAAVALAAIDAGAEIVNDISALHFDPAMAEIVRRTRAGVVLMHMRGTPQTMQQGPFARDVLRDVRGGLQSAVTRAHAAGISRRQIVLDPGIGFGKNYAQNFQLLAQFAKLAPLGYPLLAGPSRKGFIGAALGSAKNPAPPSERVWGTAATVAAAILAGAHIIRVHDVAEMVQVARIADAIRSSQ